MSDTRMRQSGWQRLRTAAVVAGALLVVACSGGGGGNAVPNTPAPPPAPVTATGLSISPGTTQLETGSTGLLTATVTYSDASTADVTRSVSWNSSQPGLLAVDQQGGILAMAAGEAVVTATHSSGVSNSARVTVLAPPPPPPPPPAPEGFVSVDGNAWTQTSVRKVLHTFAFGGLASDAQIREWADMEPAAAIEQMLTFSHVNERLSPTQDASAQHVSSLEALQAFWSGSSPDNPMRWDKRRVYATLVTTANGTTYFVSPENLQRTWVQAIRTRGGNPFLHRVAFFLTNYQLSIKASLAGIGVTRSYYDQILQDLAAQRRLTTTIGNAAKSAAVAARYIHRNNLFFNNSRTFSGNDDFAREYFQLFFRLTGLTEDPQYHEATSIHNNARVLTGMQVDRVPNAYGSTGTSDWLVAPIRFSDHYDAEGRAVFNTLLHHADCLEVLRQTICGRNAAEKLDALSPIAAAHPEVRANMPVFIIEHFADDQLTEEKMTAIRAAWLAADDDLLSFLRSYAISTTFHREDTVKFASTFNRNLSLSARTTLDNAESFLGQEVDFPRRVMRAQDGDVFEPVHDVFGAQTGVEASISTGIFKNAFDTAVATQAGLGLLETEYTTDATQSRRERWQKDWRLADPPGSGGAYTVRDIADWLWQRLLSDGGKNFDLIARSQVYALLATGQDFGAAVVTLDPALSTDPQALYSSSQLTTDPRLSAILADLASRSIDLDVAEAATRREANRRMNLAVAFISMMPYSFAIEGR